MTYPAFGPTSRQVLWEGAPDDLTNTVSGGRLQSGSYRLTTDGLQFASGVLSNREESVPLWVIQDADIVQTILQKARGVADVRLNMDPKYQGIFGQRMIILQSIRDPHWVRDLIMRQSSQVRAYWAAHHHRKTMETARAGAMNLAFNAGGSGPPSITQEPAITAAPAQPALESGGGDDIMGKLSKLGEMKSNGLLTDDEFAAAKARLLGIDQASGG